MNKSTITITLLSFCLLTSCSMFNNKDKDKAPSKKGKTDKEKTEIPPSNLVNDTGSLEETSSTMENPENENKGRVLEGFIEPDVTGLPDNKALQESINVAPIPEPLTPSNDVPEDNLLSDPNAPLPENQ
jgi:hypothetical protein